MNIFTITTPGLSVKTYVIIDDKSKKAAVIDPTRDVQPILQLLGKNNAELVYIFETHVHADFLSGAKELKSRVESKPIIACSILGGTEWFPKYADKQIQDKDQFDLGTLKLQARHAPGHTPEHLIYLLFENEKPMHLFTGDLLFVGSVGRPDLLGKGEVEKLSKDLYHSLFTLLPQLATNITIHPAHGAGSLCGKGIATDKDSTLQDERQNNPFLQKQEENLWTKNLLSEMPKAPKYFPLLKKINVAGAPLIKELTSPKKLSSNEIDKLDFKNNFLLDIRNQEEFAHSHLESSVNIPLAGSFRRWIGEFVPFNQPIVIIAKNQQEVTEATNALQLIGLDNVIGYATEIPQSKKLTSFPIPTKSEIEAQRDQIEIIDVRTDAEWNSGHIPNAKHFEINTIESSFDKFPKNKKLAFICGSGYRASIAASMAQKSGFKNVCNIKGGMHGWNSSSVGQ